MQDVSVGGGMDVDIKIIDKKNEKCVRYVFVRNGNTHKISNIPEGRYYLKIAYGKDWMSFAENEKCIGKFLRNPLYEKGKDILDFNLVYTDGGYSVPSYSLKLDVISDNISNSYDSEDIDEKDFNN